MQLVINITSMSLDYLADLYYDCYVVRTDDPANNTATIYGNSFSVNWATDTASDIYAQIADQAYSTLVSNIPTLTRVPVDYVFIGLGYNGKFDIVPQPTLFLRID